MTRIVKGLLIASIVLFAAGSVYAQDAPGQETFTRYGEAYQFVFFSVLEGLYQDGASQADVERILMKQGDEYGYEHFIYSCEICTATLLAFQLYKDRPAHNMYKGPNPNRAFGQGLSAEIQAGLNSDDVKIRLETIHGLVSDWINGRMNSMNPSDAKRASLRRAFEEGRRQGMKALEIFKKSPELIKAYAPGYADLNECAICNAAANMDFN